MALLAPVGAAIAQPDPITFQGGIFDGMRAQGRPEGGMAFIAGVAKDSPPPAIQAKGVRDIVAAARTGKLSSAPTFTTFFSRIPPQDLSNAFITLARECRADAPYEIAPNQVRLVWSCGGKVEWLSVFSLIRGSIYEIRIEPARVPPVAPAPTSH
jgi:hypothetical protein